MNTIITYAGGTPTTSGTVTLFDSTVAFPPGGCFHFLGAKWFQYDIAIGSAGGTGTGSLTGEFSTDKGSTWTTFYTATSADGLAASPANNADEVYVGEYTDVRFKFTNATEAPTVFRVAIALSPNKSTSKVTVGDKLIDTSIATSS